MGGCCCCASRSAEENNPVPEQHGHLPSHHSTVSNLSTGLLVDTNLDTSVPDTYRPPPAPIPYEAYVGNPPTSSANKQGPGHKNEVPARTTNAESLGNPTSGIPQETTEMDLESTKKVETNIELEIEDENLDGDLKKSTEPFDPLMLNDDDCCPICLEEYDEENPKLITKCDHDFHLACILEWMERSNACPVCDQVLSPPLEEK